MPALRVGLHIVLVEGRPILPPSQLPDLVDSAGLFRTDMVASGARMFFFPKVRRQLEHEIEAQFEAFRAMGLSLDHVNAHKHFHLHPTIASAILRIGKKFGMRALRVPREPGRVLAKIESQSRDAVAAITAPWSALLANRLKAHGVATPDHVFGLRWSGAMTDVRLRGLLGHLPDGLTEIYLHPATKALSGLGSRLSLCRRTRRPDRPGGRVRRPRSAHKAGRFLGFPLTYRTPARMGYNVFAKEVRRRNAPHPLPPIKKSQNK